MLIKIFREIRNSMDKSITMMERVMENVITFDVLNRLVGGRHSTEVVFALLTQLPRVWNMALIYSLAEIFLYP